jgi:hypothetical protein
MRLTVTFLALLAAFTNLGHAAELRLSGPFTHNNLITSLLMSRELAGSIGLRSRTWRLSRSAP